MRTEKFDEVSEISLCGFKQRGKNMLLMSVEFNNSSNKSNKKIMIITVLEKNMPAKPYHTNNSNNKCEMIVIRSLTLQAWMWAAAVGGLVGAWCVGMVWGWGSEGGGMGVVLPLSIIAGCFSAMVLGATLTIAAYVKLSAKHQVTIRVPPEISSLHSLTAVCQVGGHEVKAVLEFVYIG